MSFRLQPIISSDWAAGSMAGNIEARSRAENAKPGIKHVCQESMQICVRCKQRRNAPQFLGSKTGKVCKKCREVK